MEKIPATIIPADVVVDEHEYLRGEDVTHVQGSPATTGADDPAVMLGVWKMVECDNLEPYLKACGKHLLHGDDLCTVDYGCDNKRFWLSAHDCQVPTPTSQNLELEQQIWIFGAD